LKADLELATATSLSLSWDAVADGEIPTEGYVVEMLQDDDTWTIVSDTRNDPNVLFAAVHDLQTAKLYSFKVYAADFNDLSSASDIVSVHACGLPTDFKAPTYVASDQQSITIAWHAPTNQGGCPVYDYEV
jgi:hypothetical protein